jgi:DNA-binding PadR family transcriptional regulator
VRKRIEDATGLLPLMASEFQILLALADENRHGYGIMTEVRERTGGKVVLGPGTLYGTIKRLLKRGLVVEADDQADQSLGAERRKYYQLSESGRELAAAEARRLAELLHDARAKSLIPKET